MNFNVFNKILYNSPNLVVRLTVIWVALLSLQVSARGVSQTITLKVKEGSLKNVLLEIRKQSGYQLVFNSDYLNQAIPVSVNMRNVPINEALDRVLAGQPLIYEIEENTILINPKPIKTTSIAPPNRPVAPVQTTIQGTVKDPEGDPMIGVTIMEKGTTNGTTTDEQGRFTIIVKDHSAILQFSFIGYAGKEVTAETTDMAIVLEESFSSLDEAIVIGYGTQKKSDVTGAISSIKAEDLPKTASTSVEQMMAGKAAGVQVRANDAQPGGAVEILIRGAASIGAGNSPLYIIDGFPVSGGADPNTGTRYSIGNRSPLNSINPNDIESIEILKDASSTAIYGARAANGVILITTKSGKKGKPKVEYDFKRSFQNVLRPWDMLNASEWMQTRTGYLYERWLINNKIGVYGNTDPGSVSPFSPPYSEQEIANAGTGTDWISEVTRSGKIQEHNFSISGASEKTAYMVSFNYFDQTGIVRGNDFNRISGRINLTQDINTWIKVGINATGSKIAIDNPALGTGIAESSGILDAALKFTPTLPVRNESGAYSLVPNSAFFPNPVSLLELSNESQQDRLMVQSFAEFEPLRDLKIRTQIGFDKQEGVNNIYLPKSTIYGAAVGGQANINQNNRFDQLFNTTIRYRIGIGNRHDLNTLVGYEWQSMGTNGYNLSNNRFPTDVFLTNNIGAGESERPGVGSYKAVNELASYFGRINYSYDNKYLLTFTMRADGSSRFGEGNRFGYFPSGALAWRLDQEKFMEKLYWLTNAKIRLSAGQTGNSNISGAFAFYSFGRDYLFGNTVNAGTYLSSYSNPNLRWETTTEYNLGLDLGFFNNRISLSAELFSKVISDLLGQRQLKTYLPLDQVAANLGKTSSKGFEVTLNTVNTTGALQWNSSVTLSAYRDRWKERSPDVVLRAFESQTDPIRVHWGRILDGLVQPGEAVPHMPGALPGSQKVKDINGFDGNNNLTGEPDGILNEADVVKIANADPTLIFGIGNTWRYRNFDLGIHAYGMLGILRINDYMSNMTSINPNIDRGWNIPDMVDQFWSSSNQNAKYPNIHGVNPFPGWDQFLLQKADFIRIRNITLGYTLPDLGAINKWAGSIRVFLDATNPFVITGFKGIDPEFSGIYPPAKSFTVGVNLQF